MVGCSSSSTSPATDSTGSAFCEPGKVSISIDLWSSIKLLVTEHFLPVRLVSRYMNPTRAPLNTKSLSVSLRECFLFVAILGGVSVTAITEVLNTFNLITYGWLVAFWSVVLLGSTSFVITLMKRQRLVVPPQAATRLHVVSRGVRGLGRIARRRKVGS